MKRIIFRSLLPLSCLLLWSGCTSRPGKTVTEMRNGLTPAALARISATPVVDIHTHTFNARFLPLEGIMLGKRDALPPFSWFIADPVVKSLSREIAAAAGGQNGNKQRYLGRYVEELKEEIWRARGTGAKVECKELEALGRLSDSEVDGVKMKLGLQKRILLSGLSKGFGGESLLMPSGSPAIGHRGKETVLHFLHTLLESDVKKVDHFINDHGPAERPAVQLMASHMMDLAPVYDQQEDDEGLLGFTSGQLPRMQQQQDQAKGRMLYFTAYNPFRDHWRQDPEAGRGRALEIVRSGIENHGAYGVKFYPPSGYRPVGNAPPRRHLALATRYPGRQWDARYTTKDGLVKGEELDARNLEFFRWCVERDIPVFAHCGTGEFEARKKYGVTMADPRYWVELFRRHEDLKGLRLCLGHAGGSDFWFGGGKYEDWGETVHFLCTAYPNVYAEFGAHDAMVKDAAKAAFVKKLHSLLTAPRANGKYDFAKKIMYGSDWFMPMPGVRGREQFLVASQVAALEIEAAAGPQGAGFYRDFMCRNALDYLNAARRVNDPLLPAALRRNLARLLTL